MEGDRTAGERDVTHKIMTIINHTRLEAMEAKKLNAPLKTKMTAAKEKRTVHDAVTRMKIILVPGSVGNAGLYVITYTLRTRLESLPSRPAHHPWPSY